MDLLCPVIRLEKESPVEISLDFKPHCEDSWVDALMTYVFLT
jgi:hypothetical protein